MRERLVVSITIVSFRYIMIQYSELLYIVDIPITEQSSTGLLSSLLVYCIVQDHTIVDNLLNTHVLVCMHNFECYHTSIVFVFFLHHLSFLISSRVDAIIPAGVSIGRSKKV
jgi:hypothetical protein